MASTKVRGITIELGADTSGLSKALKEVNTEIGKTSKDLKDVERLLKLDPGNTELLAQKQRLLNDQIGETKTKLEALKTAQSQVDMTTDEGQREYDALTREIASCEQELKKLEDAAGEANVAVQKIGEAGEKIKDMGGKVAGVGDKLTTHITAPLVAAGAGAVKAATDWETAFTGVMKTVDETATTTYADLEKAIGEMTQRTASSRETIAGVMEIAGQLGVSADEIVGFTETMVKLGDTTNLSAEEAASAIAKFANVTGMSINNADKLGAVIVDLGNNYATTEQDIVSMATRLSGAGAQIGLSDAQILGLATALSSVGIEAEMGGSAMSKAMVKMQVAVESGASGFENLKQQLTDIGREDLAKKSFREMYVWLSNDSKALTNVAEWTGHTKKEISALLESRANLENFAEVASMTSEEFVEAYQNDAPKALQAFISGLGDTEGHGESTIAMLQEMGFTEVRLRDTLTRLANSQGLVTDAMQAGTDAWDENIALNEEAQKRYDTTAAKNTQLQEKIKGVGVELGEKLLPKVLEFMEKLSDLIDKYDALDDTQKDAMIKFAGVAAAIGPVLSVLGRLMIGMGSIMTAAPKVAGAFGKISSGLGTFGTKIAGAATKIGEFGGAVVGKLSAALPAIGNFFTADIGATMSAGGAAAGATAATALVGGITAFLGGSEIGKKVGEWIFPDDKELYEKYEGVKGTFQLYGDFFTTLGEEISDKVGTAWDNVKEATSTMVERTGEHFDNFKQKAGETWDNVKEAADTFVERINEHWTNAALKLKDFSDSAKQKFDDFKDKIREAKDKASDSIKGITDKFDDLKQKVSDKISNTAQSLGEKVSDIKGKLDDFKSKVEDLKTSVTQKFNDIKDSIIKAFNGIKDGIKAPINSMIGYFEKLINGIIDAWNGLSDRLGSLDIDVPEWVTEKTGIDDFSLSLKKYEHISIPRLAEGGIMSRGTAMVGEAGPEMLTIQNGQAIVQPLGGQNGAAELTDLLETYLPYLAMRQNILLDGKTLVGQTAQTMNEALGQIAFRGKFA